MQGRMTAERKKHEERKVETPFALFANKIIGALMANSRTALDFRYVEEISKIARWMSRLVVSSQHPSLLASQPLGFSLGNRRFFRGRDEEIFPISAERILG